MARDDVSYNSPFYADLAATTETKLGLPVGLLSSIVNKGERSNANQTSEAGARTVFQIIPETRKAALEKYGVDAYLSPENAAEVAGRLLKDSLDRNNNDVKEAVGEYIGGTDRKNWGKTTRAYINRVMTGQQSKKIDALSAGFAQFMAQNPVGSTAAQTAPQAAAQKPDPLSAGFGQWLQMGAPKTQSDMIPRDDGTFAPSQITPDAPTSLTDKIVGAGETALSLVSGATTGTLGMLGGTAKGLVNSVRNGTFGTAEGADAVERAAGEAMEAGTYAPRTQSGQNQTAAVGGALAAALPLTALTAEMGAAGQAASAAAVGARDLAVPTIARVRQASPAIAQRVQRVLSRNQEPTAQPQAAGGSVGAAGADVADMRRTSAESLPVPIDLTEGQATREHMQTAFERETAKMEGGEKLRERYAEQNEKVPQNFEAWADSTGAEAYGSRAVGEAVVGPLQQFEKHDRNRMRAAYREAEKSPEAKAPVDPSEVVSIGDGENAITDSVIGYLNSKPTGLKTTSVTDHAKQYAVRLGIAELADDGTLIPKTSTVKSMEDLRKEISQSTGIERYEIRDATILNGLIDAQTEAVAGPLYKKARATRAELARKYEDREMVSKLLNNKKGTSDRQVAMDDVFDHIVMKGSFDSRQHLREVLLKPDADVPAELKTAGEQAWKELQGALYRRLKEDSLTNVGTDVKGNRIFSAAKLDDNIRKLDEDGTLEFMLGKKGAENIRDMNDLVKLVYTAPPGTINTSGTTATLLSALGEAGVSTALVGLPFPVLTTMKFLAKRSKDIKLQKKIDAALVRRSRPQQQPRQF